MKLATVVDFRPQTPAYPDPDRENLDIPGCDEFPYETSRCEHASLLFFRSPGDPNYLLFKGLDRALLAPHSAVPQDKYSGVVFLLHGIRDYGDWLDLLKKTFNELAPGVMAVPAKYDYFNLSNFLSDRARQVRVESFCDQYVDWFARTRPGTPLHAVAHSNGSYIVGECLRRFDKVRFERIYFGGCVLSRGYNWAVLGYGVAKGSNDCATADYPVGFLCDWLGDHGWKSLGAAGVRGFLRPEDKVIETSHLVGGHSVAFEKVAGNYEMIAKFILNRLNLELDSVLERTDQGIEPRLDGLSRWSYLLVPSAAFVLPLLALSIPWAATVGLLSFTSFPLLWKLAVGFLVGVVILAVAFSYVAYHF